MAWRALVASATALAAIPALAQDAAPAGDATDPLAQAEVIGLKLESHNRLTVPVRIGNQGPYHFMIDTGAQATVVSQELADRLGIMERETATLIGAVSRRDIQVAELKRFTLGSRIFNIANVPLVAQANIGSAQGVLGLDSLQEQRVLLDFEAKTIEVADADTLGGNRGFEIVVRARSKLGQLIITEASLDGIPVSLILGTGSEGTIGNYALRDRLRGKPLGDAEMTDINGVEESTSIRLARDLRIGRARVSRVPIGFVDSPSFEALGLDNKPALILGMSELKLFRRVAIDFKERRVLLDLPKGAGWYNDPGATRFTF